MNQEFKDQPRHNSLHIHPEVGDLLDNRELYIAEAVEDIEKDVAPQPVNLETIRQLQRNTLIKSLIEQFKAGWLPTTQEIQALICVMVRDQAHIWFYSYDDDSLARYIGRDLPWPQKVREEMRAGGGGVSSLGPRTGGNDLEVAQLLIDQHFTQTRLTTNQLVDAYYDDEFDGLFIVLRKIFGQLDQKEAVRTAIFILKNLESFTDHTLEDSTTERLAALMFEGLDVYGPLALLFGHRFVQFALDKFSERLVTPGFTGMAKGDPTDEQMYFLILKLGDRLVPFYRALASGVYPSETVNYLIGLLLRDTTLPRHLNLMREALTKVPQAEKPNLENLLRSILGLMSGLPVWSNLSDLYEAIKFEDYPLSQTVESDRVAELDSLLQKYGVTPQAKVLDLGSGTGWLVHGLRQRQYQNVVGLDASARNIEVAKQTYGDHFKVGDWNNIPLSLQGQQVIFSKERTLPHTEDRHGFYRVLDQVLLRLDEGGLFIFDMPDPTQGTYQEKLAQYREAMKQFGYTNAELAQFWYVVDSPDGLNFYNRFVPSREEIKQYLSRSHFEVLEEINEPMPDGNQNMLFVCRKKTGVIFYPSPPADEQDIF